MKNIIITLGFLSLGILLAVATLAISFGSIFIQYPVVIFFCWFLYWASFNATKEAKLFFWLWSVAVGFPVCFLGYSMEPNYIARIYIVFGIMFFLASFVGGVIGIRNHDKKLEFLKIVPK